MKILLTAVNAKYIHSNLGIYSLKAYTDQVLGLGEAGGRNARAKNRGTGTGAMEPVKPCIELAEYTINHQLDQILQDIFRREPEYRIYQISNRGFRENTAGCAHMAGRTGGVL